MSPPRGSARVALIGYGMGGSLFHAPFIAAEPRLDLVTVVTANPASPGRGRRPLSGDGGGVRIEDLLVRLDEVDVVVVSTPNATHAAIAEAVLSSGRPVVVDKPVTPSAGETRRLAALAAAAGTAVVPFQNRRWDGDFRTVADLLRRGVLGTVQSSSPATSAGSLECRSIRSGRGRTTRNRGRGPASSSTSEPTSSTRLVVLFGPPRAVSADIAVRRPRGRVDDDVFVALDYPGGPQVHLWASAVAADRGPRFRLLGNDRAYVKFGMDPQEGATRRGSLPR